MRQSKESKIANVLRVAALNFQNCADLMEQPDKKGQPISNRSAARLLFRVCFLESHLPWLMKQYKEWSKIGERACQTKQK